MNATFELQSNKPRDMTELPSDIIYNILSRMPIKSLARFRCVSKLWCEYIDDPHLAIVHSDRSTEEPTPLMYYGHLNPPRIICFHITKSNKGTTILESKNYVCMEFQRNQSLNKRHVSMVRGSCNGLIYVSQDKVPDDTICLVVIHPVRNEWFELPPMTRQESSSGLGFDASTNTFKMVCVLSSEQGYLDLDTVSMNLCTMVHALGTDSWRKIPEVPTHPIAGEGVFAHGCLHWLNKDVSHNNFPDFAPKYRRKVTCFDVKKEEFRVMNPPKETKTGWIFHELVDLDGEVGYAYYYLHHSIEVWVLKGKEWVMRYRIDQKPPLPKGYMKVLGGWNKEGDILIRTHGGGVRLFVYRLKSGVLDEVNIVCEGDKYKEYMYLYPASNLFSIRGI